MKTIPRSEWGAKPWRNSIGTRPMSAVSWFLVHYHGGPPPASVGMAVPRNIEAIHLGNGWSGVGYSWIVDQAGTIYEGRGWSLIGAHSPPHNYDGIGVYVAVGGDQEPTPAALASVRWLYDEASRRAGRSLRKSWHGYDYPTACPGPRLIAWVKDGMPAKGATPTPAAPTEPDPDLKVVQALVGVTPDGIDGPATRAAVKEHQAALGLAVDGIAGPITRGALMALQDDIKALTAKVDDVEDWTRKAVNNALWAGPSRTIAALSAVLADTQGVDVDKLAAAIAEQIRDDVAKAGSGATAEQIADVLAKRLAS